MAVISTETAEHYPWGEACEGWHLLRDPSLSAPKNACRQALRSRVIGIVAHGIFSMCWPVR